jgi:acyl-CoA thioesterase
MKSPIEIVHSMMDADAFSSWLGIELLVVEKGKVSVSCKVREEMVNGFRIAHGGISFALGDSALAFAANSNGKHAVSIECNISHLATVFVGDVLTASTEEIKFGKQTATYICSVRNQEDKLVAHLKGVFFIKENFW